MSSYSLTYTSSNKSTKQVSGYGQIYAYAGISNWSDTDTQLSFTLTSYVHGTSSGTWSGPWGYGFDLQAGYVDNGNEYQNSAVNTYYDYGAVRSSSMNITLTKGKTARTVQLYLDMDSAACGGYGAAPSSILFDWINVGSVSLSAKTSYTVSYNANGGSGAPSSQTKWHGETLTLSSTKPTRTGYTFQGWGTSASDTTADYAAGGSYTANSGTTLYAVWKANAYKVTFNANKGTTPTESKSVTYDSTYGDLPTPTRTGYTFNGWYTAASGGTKVTSSTKVTITAAQTLYAHWTANTYKVSFDSNGGSGSMSQQTHTYDESKNLTANAFTRTGYTFVNWNTKKDGTGTSYSNNASVKNLSSTSGAVVTLYAQWREHVLTVRYKSNYATYAYVDGAENTDVSANEKDIIVRTSTYGYATTIPDGLNKYSGVNDDTYMKRTRYDATGYWGTGSDPETESIITVSEDKPFDSGAELAETLGILESLEDGDATIDLYAQWVLLCSRITIYNEKGEAQKGMVHIYVDNDVNFITSDGDMFKDSNDDYFMTNDGSVLHYGIITVFGADGKAYVAI